MVACLQWHRCNAPAGPFNFCCYVVFVESDIMCSAFVLACPALCAPACPHHANVAVMPSRVALHVQEFLHPIATLVCLLYPSQAVDLRSLLQGRLMVLRSCVPRQ